jgi:hypothetical protein
MSSPVADKKDVLTLIRSTGIAHPNIKDNTQNNEIVLIARIGAPDLFHSN